MVDPTPHRLVVLVVDDNPDILSAHAEILRRAGLEPLTARDGQAALELAFRLRPDVIVIDLWMPEMDGFEVARALRADERTRGTPIIAFTSLGYTVRKAVAAGCDALVRKGDDPEQLLVTIRKLTRATPAAALAPPSPTAG
jgi:two-component system cell cycle response regulator DivK